jgi:hypothetical protein
MSNFEAGLLFGIPITKGQVHRMLGYPKLACQMYDRMKMMYMTHLRHII